MRIMPVRMLVATATAATAVVNLRIGISTCGTGTNVPFHYLVSLRLGRALGHYIDFGILIHYTHLITPKFWFELPL